MYDHQRHIKVVAWGFYKFGRIYRVFLSLPLTLVIVKHLIFWGVEVDGCCPPYATTFKDTSVHIYISIPLRIQELCAQTKREEMN